MVELVSHDVSLRRFSVAEYHRMGEAGILAPDERVELIRGVVRQMSPKGRRHVISVSKATEILVLAVSGRARVYVQDPLTSEPLSSEPEPDLCVTASVDPQAYGTAEAKAELVIEVAESSLSYDRAVKGPLYADARVPEHWIVNLVDEVVEVYRNPKEGGYRSRTISKRGDQLRPLAWPDVSIAVDDLLP